MSANANVPSWRDVETAIKVLGITDPEEQLAMHRFYARYREHREQRPGLRVTWRGALWFAAKWGFCGLVVWGFITGKLAFSLKNFLR